LEKGPLPNYTLKNITHKTTQVRHNLLISVEKSNLFSNVFLLQTNM